MEALMLSCSTGGGHNSASRAMVSELENRGWTASLMDPFTLQSDEMARRVGDLYINIVKRYPSLFGHIYNLGKHYELMEKYLPIGSPVLQFQKKTAVLLGQYLEEHHPDVIICTHPYPGMMITQLKRMGHPLPPTFMVATDYTCIPFETQAECDYMVIGSEKLKEEFLQWGLDPAHVLSTGIPVDPKFEEPKDRQTLRQAHQIPEDRKLILIAAGSMGTSGLLNVLESLRPWLTSDSRIHALVVCGTNEDLKQKLEEQNFPHLTALGFTDKMDELLAISDLYITKPGGLSITEAAATGIPLLLTDPIPGCEDANAEFFSRLGMADFARYRTSLPDAIHSILQPERVKAMLEAQKTELPHHSAAALADFIEDLLQRQAALEKPDPDKEEIPGEEAQANSFWRILFSPRFRH